jgi:hypothetical protein
MKMEVKQESDQARHTYGLLSKSLEIPISGEIVDKLLKGAIDFHCHSAPDPYVKRPYDDLEIAMKGYSDGMGGIVFKCQGGSTAARAVLVKKALRKLLNETQEREFAVLGGPVLNYAVGGLNLDMVKADVRLGAKVMWLPTMDGHNHRHMTGKEGGIRVVAEDGSIVRELREILRIAAENDVVVSVGHSSPSEALTIIEAAKELGVKILVDHPTFSPTRYTMDEVVKAARMGAYMCLPIGTGLPTLYSPNADPRETVAIIKQVGADHCIAASDLGQYGNPHPVEGLKMYIAALLLMDVSPTTIQTIFKENPAKLLNL